MYRRLAVIVRSACYVYALADFLCSHRVTDHVMIILNFTDESLLA